MAHPDFIAECGVAFLAHRLRRASELLVEGTGAWLPDHGMNAPPRTLSSLLLLSLEGPMSITELAERLRISHPMMIKLVRGLEAEALVRTSRDPADARRRLVVLTEEGEREATMARKAIDVLARAYDAMFADMGVDLFAAVARLERACAETPIAERLARAAQETKVKELSR
jgi:DNA-binding MarR family transcriptional regulator